MRGRSALAANRAHRASQPAEEEVVLVHGLWLSTAAMRPLAGRLARHGYRCRCFGYASMRADLYQHAAALRRFIAARDAPVHLVGHSLGALVLLRMLERAPPPLGRLVLLAPPAQGSRAAAALSRRVWGRGLLGGSARAGGLLEPVTPWTGQGELGIIAGVLRLGLGRLLVPFEGPNDGTLALEETELAGAAERLVLPVSHFGLLLSPTVAEQVAYFLRHGHFAAATAVAGADE